MAGESAGGAENAGDVWNYEAAEVVYNEEKYSLRHVEGLSSVGGGGAPWVLFQDGYDAKGNRLYDKAAGMTCHQCRQKTLGKRTACSGCGSLHGVFCGDCLWMRYGEHVDEVMEGGGAGWVCPPCRDLCNCSFCRSRKGWCPTGTLYRRVVAEGWVVDLCLCLCLAVPDGDGAVVRSGRSLTRLLTRLLTRVARYKSVAHFLVMEYVDEEDAAAVAKVEEMRREMGIVKEEEAKGGEERESKDEAPQ